VGGVFSHEGRHVVEVGQDVPGYDQESAHGSEMGAVYGIRAAVEATGFGELRGCGDGAECEAVDAKMFFA